MEYWVKSWLIVLKKSEILMKSVKIIGNLAKKPKILIKKPYENQKNSPFKSH